MARRFHAAAPVAAPARLRGGRASQGSALREEERPRRRSGLPCQGEEAGASPCGVPAGGGRRLASDLHHAPAPKPRRAATRRQGDPRRLALDDARQGLHRPAQPEQPEQPDRELRERRATGRDPLGRDRGSDDQQRFRANLALPRVRERADRPAPGHARRERRRARVRRKGTRVHRAQHGRARVVRLLATRAIRSPFMFEIEERGGLGRRALWTRGDRSLTTPLVLFVQEGPRAAPSYAEALFVSERTDDPRFQIRHGGSFFAPRPAAHPDDLPPTKGTPLSLEGLEIPQEGMARDLAIGTGESDLPSGKSAQAGFLADGPGVDRSPRAFVGMARRVRETLGPAKVVAVARPATPCHLSVLVYAGIDVVDSSRMVLDSARDLFHTADGAVPAADADRDACGCPACAASEGLRAHNERALYREMLLVRSHLMHGRLREHVERRLAKAPCNTAGGPPLDLRAYDSA